LFGGIPDALEQSLRRYSGLARQGAQSTNDPPILTTEAPREVSAEKSRCGADGLFELVQIGREYRRVKFFENFIDPTLNFKQIP